MAAEENEDNEIPNLLNLATTTGNTNTGSNFSLSSFHTACETLDDDASAAHDSGLQSVETDLLHPESVHLPELYIFKFDLFLAILGFMLSLFDWGSDIWMSASHFMRGNDMEGGLTIGIVICAGMLSFMRFKYKGFPTILKTFSRSYVRFLMHIPSLQAIAMSLESIRFELYPDTVRAAIRRENLLAPDGPVGIDTEIYCFLRFHDALLEQNQFYKSMETVFEAGPQILLQVYIFMFHIQQVTFLGGLEAAVAVLLSLSSVASCSRGNFMSKYNILENSPPLVVKVFLPIFSMLKYFYRTVASLVGFVCVFQGFQLFCVWYLAGFLTIIVVILPRLIYLAYDIINVMYLQSSKIDAFSEIGMTYIIEQTVVTLVCSGPTQRKSSTMIYQTRFEIFLIIEPIAHLTFWALVQYFLNLEISFMFIVIFIASVLVFYMLHFLSDKILLRWTLNTVKYWEQCNFIISACEAILRDLKSERKGGTYHAKTLQTNLINDDELVNCYSTQLGVQETIDMLKTLIRFYKKCYNRFDELYLQAELLEKNRHIQVLLEFTMLKLTHHLLTVKWTDEENLTNSVICVLSYLRYRKIEGADKVEKLGAYYKFFRDGRQQFKCQGVLHKFNQRKLPRLREKIMYGFVDES